jgi:hypothetical protein
MLPLNRENIAFRRTRLPGPIGWLLDMDTPIPNRWGPALQAALWGAAPFVFFMAAVIEGAIAGNYLIAVVCGILFFVSIGIVVNWDRLVPPRLRAEAQSSLKYLDHRDSHLGSAIISMARQSAWGRWYAAQHLVNSGSPIRQQHLYQTAASQVMQSITDGDIEVRGRRPDPSQLNYEPIDRTHWQSSWLFATPDPVSLWKVVIGPRGGAEFDRDGAMVRADNPTAAHRTSLLDYDSLIVDAYQFEKIWPRTKYLTDKRRRKFLRQARKRQLDKDEIQRLSDPQKARFGLLLLVIIGALIGVIVLGFLFAVYEGALPIIPYFHSGRAAAPSDVATPSSAPQPQQTTKQEETARQNVHATLIAWQGVKLAMDELATFLDAQDAAVKNYEDAGDIQNIRVKLEDLHHNTAAYFPEIAELLRVAVRPPGAPSVPGSIFDQLQRSSGIYAEQIKSSATPPTEEDRVRLALPAQVFRQNINAVRNWEKQVAQTVDQQIKRLTMMESAK